MVDKLYIDTLSGAEIAKIEARMRPGQSSRAGFLGPDESLKQVIYEDATTLKRLGVTYEQIAFELESLVKNPYKSPPFKVVVDSTNGVQEDPFCEDQVYHDFCSEECTITNPEDQSLRFPGLIIALIRNYQFFEGKGTSYRLDPETVVKVLKLK